MCDLPNSDRLQFYLHPAVVRRNDTSAKSINEWTREKTLRCCRSFLAATPACHVEPVLIAGVLLACALRSTIGRLCAR